MDTTIDRNNFAMKMLLILFFVILKLFAASLVAQQLYSGNSVMNCNNTDDAGPSPSFLYTCNGEKHMCQAFLIFRSQTKYNSATTISNLTSSDVQKLAHINNISSSEILSLDREIIVPANCSCSGQYYQANASYTTQSVYDTYFTIANNTYQGLSTCDALIRENSYGIFDLEPGMNLRIPLRCACPTKDQIKQGIKFLLTYLVTWGDSIPDLGKRFNVSNRSVADANGFSEEEPTIYPFTTILIPLPRKPLSSQTRFYSPPVVIPPPFLETASTKTKKSRKGIYIGVAIGSSAGLICYSLFLLFFFHRGGRIDTGSEKNEERIKIATLRAKLQNKIADVDQVLKIYAFEELEAATENFHPQRRLSDSVYRGVLRGKLSAIKKMSNDVNKEVEILSKINHFNLISLYGACEQNEVFYLVYEFMENGSLKEWLQQQSCPETQSWNNRICIALDVANGLDYLHNFTSPGYVHKHINSSNILLNRDLRAKIANFSFARLADGGENGNSSSTLVQGVKGYMAPEHLEAGKVTPKLDVYAFGVVLFQLITGREAIFKQDEEEVLLSETVISVADAARAEDALGRLIDPRLQVKHPLGFIIDQTEVALRMVNLSAVCLAQEPARRPSMAKVVSSLMKIQSDVYKPESFSIQ